MDALDLRILRELAQAQTVWPIRHGRIPSYRTVARHVRAAPSTVRNRLLELRRSGFLLGMITLPNPALLGLASGSYGVEVPDGPTRAAALDGLLRLEGVVFVEVFRSSLIGVALTYEDERDLARLLARIDAETGAPHGVFTTVTLAPHGTSLTHADWDLLARLVVGSNSSWSTEARALGMSTRMLRRRLAALESARALLTFPHLDFGSLAVGVPIELLVWFRPGVDHRAVEQDLLERLGPHLLYAGLWAEFSIFRLIVPNLPAADRAEAIARGVPGVQKVRVEIIRALHYRPDTLQRQVRAAARQDTARARRAGRVVRRPGTDFGGAIRRDGYRIFPPRTTGVPSTLTSDPARQMDPAKSEVLFPPE